MSQRTVDDCIVQAAIRPLSAQEVRADLETLRSHTLTGWPKRVEDGGEVYLMLWASLARAQYERVSDHKRFTVERHG